MNTVENRILPAAMRLFAERGGTQIAVSDLARAAGVSRGTIYNNTSNPCGLYDAVCDMIATEMAQSIDRRLVGIDDPAQKLSNIVRLPLRRVHEDPHWGRFIARYAMGEPRLGQFWRSTPAAELRRGLALGRFDFAPEQVASITAASGGATFGAMTLILGGHRTWRQVSEDTAELVLRSVGIPRDEARALATIEIDPLPRIDHLDAARH